MQLQTVMALDPVTVQADATVAVAAARMRDGNVGCLVVMDKRKVVGVITDRDLVVRCMAKGAGHAPDICLVSNHMSHPVVTRPAQTDVLAAAHLMKEARIKRLVITDIGELVGLVSFSDIAIALDKPVHDLLLGMAAARRMTPTPSDTASSDQLSVTDVVRTGALPLARQSATANTVKAAADRVPPRPVDTAAGVDA